MPRKSVITREGILSAAAEVVRKKGESSLNARSVAEELGCSTQPVYSVFAGMEELKTALLEEAKTQYHRFIEEYLEKSGRSRYECFGMGFVRFAYEERGLFQFLFMHAREVAPERLEPDPFIEEIVAEMMKLYRMPEEKARAFHADMAVFSYGLAVLVNTGNLKPSDKDISEYLKRQFYGLYAVYFPERPKLP